MNRSFALVLVFALAMLAILAGLNWPALATAVPLSVGFYQADVPLGFIVLAAAAVLALLLVVQAAMRRLGRLIRPRREDRRLAP